MTFVPYLINEFVNECLDKGHCEFLSQFVDPNVLFKMNDEFWCAMKAGQRSKRRSDSPDDDGVRVSVESTHFKVSLNVRHYKPEEINVKVVDKYVVVEGKQEEMEDKYGFVSRQFTRRFKLPEDVQEEGITSSISSDGILKVMAPKKTESPQSAGERQIPVVRTGEPVLSRSRHSRRSANSTSGTNGASGSQEKMDS